MVVRTCPCELVESRVVSNSHNDRDVCGDLAGTATGVGLAELDAVPGGAEIHRERLPLPGVLGVLPDAQLDVEVAVHDRATAV